MGDKFVTILNDNIVIFKVDNIHLYFNVKALNYIDILSSLEEMYGR